MSKSFDTLCDLSKSQIRDRLDEIAALVDRPAFICRKCARVANTKDILCKPKRIKRTGKGVKPSSS